MKEFLEPRLEILQFYAEDILTQSGGLEDDENTGGGIPLPGVPVPHG